VDGRVEAREKESWQVAGEREGERGREREGERERGRGRETLRSGQLTPPLFFILRLYDLNVGVELESLIH